MNRTLSTFLLPLVLSLGACTESTAGQAGALSEEEEVLLSNLRFAIGIPAQDVLAGIDANSLELAGGMLVLRVGADRATDAFELCDSIFATSGGYGRLTPTQILVDGRLAAEGLIDEEGLGECHHR